VLNNKTVNKIVYMLVGLVVGWIFYGYVQSSTNNPILAMVGFAVVLAFWIGTLQVIFRHGGED
jgi:hypothetical protein